MEVRPVWSTNDKIRADAACEELRARDIKCDTLEPSLPATRAPFMQRIDEYTVVVAPDDEERADEVLRAWLSGPTD
jgi:hypothetical protein